jgi:serine protease Do
MKMILTAPKQWLILVLSLVLIAPAALAARPELPDFTKLVKENSPAVVNISTTQKVSMQPGQLPPGLQELPPDHPLRDFFERFGGEGGGAPEGFDAQSLGSGFITSPDGYILTNNHVVKDADEVIVRLSDRREFVAELVGQDERSDLALLKIEAADLPVVRLGSSSALQVGEWVLAIGSPFGFEHSATSGIVSAKGRNLPRENYVPFIQTDVAINPGNSGGPLFNLDGEVVGINSQIYSRTGGFMGVSFAIPIELALNVAEQLKSSGHVTRGWLGVLIQDVTRDLAESFGMATPAGALVAQVVPESPAAKAGVQVGDVIVEFAGKEIATSAMLPPLVGSSEIGERMSMKVLRDGKLRTLNVEIEALPEEPGVQSPPPKAPEKSGFSSELLGISADEIAPEQREALGAPAGGVVITDVNSGPAEEAGLAAGDVLSMLNQQQITDLASLRRAIEGLPAGKSVPLLVIREGAPRFLALKVPEKK